MNRPFVNYYIFIKILKYCKQHNLKCLNRLSKTYHEIVQTELVHLFNASEMGSFNKKYHYKFCLNDDFSSKNVKFVITNSETVYGYIHRNMGNDQISGLTKLKNL